MKSTSESTQEWSRDVIDRQVSQLTRMVDDLLDVGRITSGKIALHKEPLELNAAVVRAAEAAQPLADARGHKLDVRLARDSLLVDGDLAIVRVKDSGIGMQRLVRVEIPIALPVILAGVRVAVVLNIGVTAIAAYIGAGGLGTFISRGISQTDIRQLITGALSLGLLAIAADYALLRLQRRLTPKGLAVRTE